MYQTANNTIVTGVSFASIVLAYGEVISQCKGLRLARLTNWTTVAKLNIPQTLPCLFCLIRHVLMLLWRTGGLHRCSLSTRIKMAQLRLLRLPVQMWQPSVRRRLRSMATSYAVAVLSRSI